jgi:hypothetical protein
VDHGPYQKSKQNAHLRRKEMREAESLGSA